MPQHPSPHKNSRRHPWVPSLRGAAPQGASSLLRPLPQIHDALAPWTPHCPISRQKPSVLDSLRASRLRTDIIGPRADSFFSPPRGEVVLLRTHARRARYVLGCLFSYRRPLWRLFRGTCLCSAPSAYGRLPCFLPAPRIHRWSWWALVFRVLVHSGSAQISNGVSVPFVQLAGRLRNPRSGPFHNPYLVHMFPPVSACVSNVAAPRPRWQSARPPRGYHDWSVRQTNRFPKERTTTFVVFTSDQGIFQY